MRDNRSKTWLKVGCFGCAIVPCLLGGLTCGYIKMRIGQQAARLPAEVAKLRKMGVPTEPADLAPKPPIPDSQNAAETYRQIQAEYDKLKGDPSNKELIRALSNFLGSSRRLGDDKLAQQGIAKFSKMFALGDSLLSKPSLYFDRDYSQGFALLFPEYANMKTMAKWEVSRAALQMDSGDFRGALKSIHVALQISAHLTNDVTLIGALVSIATEAIAFNGLDRYLERIKDNPAMLAETRKMLEGMKLDISLRHAFSGELVLGRIGVRAIRSLQDLQMLTGGNDDSGAEGSQGPSEVDKALGRITADPSVRGMIEYKFVEKWREAFEKMPADGTDWRGINATMAEISKEIEADKSIEGRVNQIVFPVFDEAGNAVGQMQARTRLSLLAVRLLQDRRSGLPKDLTRYGKLGIDPMDGKPMRYQVAGRGFKIWSIGRDLVDDGGVKYVPGSGMNNKHTDIVLEYDYGRH